MNFVAVRLQQNVGENGEGGAGADYVLHLLQAFEQFFFCNTEFHDGKEHLRCKALDFIRPPQSQRKSFRELRSSRYLCSELSKRDRLANIVLLGHASLYQFTSVQDRAVIA